MSKDEVNHLLLVWGLRMFALAYISAFLYNCFRVAKLWNAKSDEWINSILWVVLLAGAVAVFWCIGFYFNLPDHPLPR